jgi:hypothetical protein
VSVQERELRERLERLLDDIEPRPAPVAGAMRMGQRIRLRRRVLAAAGLVALASAAAAVPSLLHRPAPLPAPPLVNSVTVHPPGRGAGSGVIATGSVDGQHWVARLKGSGKHVIARFGPGYQSVPLGGQAGSGPDLVDFESIGGAAGAIGYVGPVVPSVAALDVTLDNGQVLDLFPQRWQGHRYVAMVIPVTLKVTDVVALGSAAYLQPEFVGDDVVGHAVPFEYDGQAIFDEWLGPGKSGLARRTVRLAAGYTGSHHWSATVYAGPWGLCIETVRSADANGACIDTGDSARLTALTSPFALAGPVDIGFARPDVRYLVLTRSDGSQFRVRVARVDGYALFAFPASKRQRIVSWYAVGASATLGGGQGNPAGR